MAASPVDWDGAIEVLERAHKGMPRLLKVLADGAYRAKELAGWIARSLVSWVLETTGPKPGQKKFEPIRWRWIVERTFGWLGRYRRLSKDYEATTRSSEAWIFIAMSHRMCRLLYPHKNRDDDLLRRPTKRRDC